MINKDLNSISDIRHDGKIITQVYKGLRLVWSAIKSCFGNGYWINTAPWLNSDAWKNI